MPKFKLYFYAIISSCCGAAAVSRTVRIGSIDPESVLMFLGALIWFEKIVEFYKR